ncbi:MAG: hypothetical protein M0T70_00800 [Geobacteraceae bacterium]|nr:hypothetical protein [Geobacteraceae bacterium]
MKYPPVTVQSCRHAFRLFVLISLLTACTEQRAVAPKATTVTASNNSSHAAPAAFAANSSSAPTAFSATSSAIRKASAVAAVRSSAHTDPRQVKYNAGENPEFAKKCGWPVDCPAPLPGSILPHKRIVAYYGNPLSKKMGVLGEYPKAVMLQKLKSETARWQAADPATPVQPALHLIAVVAQGAPGKDGKYRMIIPDRIINQVYGWAKEAGAIMFIDIQTGHDDIRAVLPRFEWILKNPDVHLGIDPEFNLIKSGKKPGTKIGTYDAADINYASGYLKDLVRKYHLPPKVFTVHRFTRAGVTNAKDIRLRPEVQIVMNMDGWGAPWLKRDSYKSYVVAEPVQYTGFKLFYHNDTKKGDPLLTPREVLKLNPKPLYIQYQ